MPTYTFPKQSPTEIRRNLSKVVPIIILIGLGPLAMFYAMLPDYFYWMLGFFVLIVLIGITLGVFTQSRTQLTIDNNQLTLSRPGKPPITIARDEIKSIVEDAARGIRVVSQDSANGIFIPIDLVEYQAVRSELITWYPILPASPGDNRLLTYTISLIAISSISAIGAFVFRIKVFFYIFAASFLIIAIGSMVAGFKDKGQPKTKKSQGLVQKVILILVLLYFAYRIIVTFIF